jgi:hypothetical protein
VTTSPTSADRTPTRLPVVPLEFLSTSVKLRQVPRSVSRRVRLKLTFFDS